MSDFSLRFFLLVHPPFFFEKLIGTKNNKHIYDSEWSFGGLPVWLLHTANISFRDANPQWQDAMSTFITWVASIVEPYLAKNGGPIILAQIENEYEGSADYVNWCGNLASSLNFEIPWIMCNGQSANNTINSCNGNDCYNTFLASHLKEYPNQPLMWTENEAWFQFWGSNGRRVYVANETGQGNRSPQDMAYVICKWFAGGGASHNYYMYAGGNHISWTAGSSITSYYDDGANYHGDGLANEPKKSHLSKLHFILGQNQQALLEDSIQYGHEIYINTVTPENDTRSLMMSLFIKPCDEVNKLQRFKLDVNDNTLLELANGKYCAVSPDKENDYITLVHCDGNKSDQKWKYNDHSPSSARDSYSSTIQSMTSGMCLVPVGVLIHALDCSDDDNIKQRWYYNSTTQMLKWNSDRNKCLTGVSNESNTFAYVYQSRNDSNNKVTFLLNVDSSKDYTVSWEGIEYYLPNQSVSILDNNGEELFNSAKVDTTSVASKRIYKTLYSGKNDLLFESWSETVPLTNNSQNRTDRARFNLKPLEQIRFSNNTSEYLYYSTEIKTDFSKLNIISYPNNNSDLKLIFEGTRACSYMVWFNSEFVGSQWDGTHWFNVSGPLNYTMNIGDVIGNVIGNVIDDGYRNCSNNNINCTLTILSSSLGISNVINNQQGSDAQDKKGLVGGIWIYDSKNNKIIDNYSNNGWNHWIGATGQVLNVN